MSVKAAKTESLLLKSVATCETGDCKHGCGFITVNECKPGLWCDYCHHPICASESYAILKAKSKISKMAANKKAKKRKQQAKSAIAQLETSQPKSP